MAGEHTEVDEVALRRALGALVSEGLRPYNVGEHGGALLDLELVRSRMPEHLRDDDDHKDYDAAAAAALRPVLEAAVDKDHIDSRKHRRLLRIVFGLRDGATAEESISVRRAAAARAISGKKEIQSETVRTHHEPRALDALARALVSLEGKHRNGGKA